MAYFERLGEQRFTATELAGGAWNPEEQHIAPMMGLMTHLTELDHVPRDPEKLMLPGRISVEILGTLSFEPFDIEVEVTRPGRTIELIEAVCIQSGRPAVRVRTWFLKKGETETIAGTEFPEIPGPSDDALPGLGIGWSGGFAGSIVGRREQTAPGRGFAWWSTEVPLLKEEDTSNLAMYMGLVDFANGIAVRADPKEVIFPNLDLTAHFFRLPEGKWVGADTSVSFGASGIGLTNSVLHDEFGPIGTCSQVLTVRPMQ